MLSRIVVVVLVILLSGVVGVQAVDWSSWFGNSASVCSGDLSPETKAEFVASIEKTVRQAVREELYHLPANVTEKIAEGLVNHTLTRLEREIGMPLHTVLKTAYNGVLQLVSFMDAYNLTINGSATNNVSAYYVPRYTATVIHVAVTALITDAFPSRYQFVAWVFGQLAWFGLSFITMVCQGLYAMFTDIKLSVGTSEYRPFGGTFEATGVHWIAGVVSNVTCVFLTYTFFITWACDHLVLLWNILKPTQLLKRGLIRCARSVASVFTAAVTSSPAPAAEETTGCKQPAIDATAILEPEPGTGGSIPGGASSPTADWNTPSPYAVYGPPRTVLGCSD